MSRPSDASQDTPQSWPASCRPLVVKDLLQGQDTLAGIIHQYGIPLETVIHFPEQCLQGYAKAAATSDSQPEGLLVQGIQPLQSRFSGPS